MTMLLDQDEWLLDSGAFEHIISDEQIRPSL